jgi:hypothetical protein
MSPQVIPFSFWKTSALAEVTQFTFGDGSTLNGPLPQISQITLTDMYNIPLGYKAKWSGTAGSAATLTAATVDPRTLVIYFQTGVSVPQNAYFYFSGGNQDLWYLWYNVDGDGSDPFPAQGGTGIMVSVDSTDTTNTVIADKTVTAITGHPEFSSSYANGDGSFNIYAYTAGGSLGVTDVATSTVYYWSLVGGGSGNDSSYFTAGPTADDCFYYVIDGVGAAPLGYTNYYYINLTSTNTDYEVATYTSYVLYAAGYVNNFVSGGFFYFDLKKYGDSITDGVVSTGFGFSEYAPENPPLYIEFNDQYNNILMLSVDGDDLQGATPTPTIIASTYASADVNTLIDECVSAITGNYVGLDATHAGYGYMLVTYSTYDAIYHAPTFNPGYEGNYFPGGSSYQNPTPSPYILFYDPVLGGFYAWSYVYGVSVNAGIDPGFGGMTGIQVFLYQAHTAEQCCYNFAHQVNLTMMGLGGFVFTENFSATNTMTNLNKGPVTDASESSTPTFASSGLSITVTQQGRN